MQGLPFALHSLMGAHHPWSGHYNVRTPIWAAAHMNQHTAIGTPHDSSLQVLTAFRFLFPTVCRKVDSR